MTGRLNINRLHVFPVGRMLSALAAVFVVGLLAAVFLSQLAAHVLGGGGVAVTVIATVAQNLLAFALPAVVVGMSCGGAGRFLALSRRPPVGSVAFMVIIYVALTPAMNWLVAWNEAISLPEAMAPLERLLRDSEEAARAATDRLIYADSVWRLASVVLLVGVLTGLCEEMFFRGALQRVLSRGSAGKHLAVWVSAMVFSALHFQFYGFVPRLVLGAFFGYMLWWSGSLWVPVIGHALNNSIVVVATYLGRHGVEAAKEIDGLGVGDGGALTATAVASAVAAVALMLAYRKIYGGRIRRGQWER